MVDPLAYNKYFPQGTGFPRQGNEISTLDKMQEEIINVYGISMDYYPVEVDINKKLTVGFGEDTTKRYLKKVPFKGKVDTDGFDENLLYSGFGELNNIEFRIFVHLPSVLKLIGREPIAGDQFYLPYNSTFVYEVTLAQHAAFGRKGNIFGFKSAFVINAKERAVGPTSAGYSERFGVLDANGNLRTDAPSDAIINDGTGRVKEKYNVQAPKISEHIFHDNDAVKEAIDGTTGKGSGIRTPISDDIERRWGGF